MLLSVVVAASVYKSRTVFGAGGLLIDVMISWRSAAPVAPGIFTFSSTNMGADTVGASVIGAVVIR
jgi:hypothetical protein